MHAVELNLSQSDEAQRRFQAYVEAAKRAQSSLDIRDGLEAGQRWRAWLDLFLPPESPMPRSALRVVK